MSKRLLALVACLPFLFGADRFVRPNGSDTCTGNADQDCTGGGAPATCAEGTNCAKATPQQAMAVFNCATPDHLYVRAGTYSGGITTPDPCFGPADNNRAVIECEAGATLSGADGVNDTLKLHNDSTSWSARNKFLTVTGCTIYGSDKRGIEASGTWEGIWIDNNDITLDDGDADTANNGAACIRLADGNGGWWGSRVTGNTCTGTGTATSAGLTGSNAVFIRSDQGNCTAGCTLEKGIWMSGNTATNILGALFDGNATDGIIENNIEDGSACIGDESACLQIYNSQNTIVRYNLFVNVRPNGGTGVRVISAPRSSFDTASYPSSITAYNNTLIGVNNNSAVPTAGKHAFSAQGATIYSGSNKSYFLNNVIMRNFGNDAAAYGGAPAGSDVYAVNVTNCPSAGFDVMNNLVYNVGWRNDGTTTPNNNLTIKPLSGNCVTVGAVISGTIENTDPSLETTNWTPDSASDPVCGAGLTTLSAPAQANRPADTSKSWIGYAQGACAGVSSTQGKGVAVKGAIIR